jgi:hypothetical protein
MSHPLAIVRIKKGILGTLPLALESTQRNPLSGPFDTAMRARLTHAVGRFPFAQRLAHARKDTYEIDAPEGGRLIVWLTGDGHIFMDSHGALELALSVYMDLLALVGDLALEDRLRGVLHSMESFDALINDTPNVAVPAVALP